MQEKGSWNSACWTRSQTENTKQHLLNQRLFGAIRPKTHLNDGNITFLTYRSWICVDFADHHIQHGRFSSSVRTKKTKDFTLIDSETYSIDNRRSLRWKLLLDFPHDNWWSLKRMTIITGVSYPTLPTGAALSFYGEWDSCLSAVLCIVAKECKSVSMTKT